MWSQTNKTCKVISFVAIAMCVWLNGIAQTISKPNVSFACFVNENEPQNVRATVSGGSFPEGTTFILRLSNKSGGFNSGSVIVAETQSVGDDIIFDGFSYPIIDGEGTKLGSDTYRVRIEQKSNPSKDSRSDEFSAFFDNTNYLLNPRVLCEFGQLRATPDNLAEYVWYRAPITSSFPTIDGSAVIIAGESGNTIEANIEGKYFFRPPLGGCQGFLDQAESNFVTVFAAKATAVPDFSISITAGSTPFCAGEGSVTLTSSISNPTFFYQWIRDGEALTGENGTSITVSDINAEGNYLLEVSDDSQRLSERCASQSQNSIFIDLNNPFANFPDSQELIVVDFPGIDEVLNVNVSGQNPKTIVWLKDNVEIPETNAASLVSTGPGKYTVKVTGSSCATFNEDITDTEVNVVAINNLDIEIEYDNPNYIGCSLSNIGLRIKSISTTVNAEVFSIPITSFSPENVIWLNNGTQVTELSGPNIIIDDAGGNGNYEARINISGDSKSNSLSVKLNPGELSIESSNNFRLDEANPNVELSVPLPATAIQSLYTYRWFKVASLGQEEQISTSSTAQVTEPGNYYVEVTFDDCPPSRLNTIAISSTSVEVPNIITPNGFNNTKWRLPAEFTLQPDVTIQIISSSGKEVLNQNNYSGNWPDDELTESIYYYIISKNNNPMKKGTITIVR